MSKPSESKSDEYDPIIYHHHLEFENRRLRASGDDFQDLFEAIMVRARPGEFERVRPYGRFGDRKCDGLIESEGIIFQVYSPDELKQSEVQKKIDADLAGAAQHWQGTLKKWVFVYNVKRGIAADLKRTLEQKRKQYPDIEIDSWSNDYLWEIARGLKVGQRNEIFGLSPSTVKTNQTSISLINPQDHETKWREICKALLSHWKGLTTNALTKPNGVHFQLDEIFVPLGLLERRQKPRHSPASASPEKGSELYEEKVTPINQDEFFEQVLRQGHSKYSQGKRIAIIGEPGAGKTTQLQKIGNWILTQEEIPIWVPLAAVGSKTLREYLLNDWLQTAIQELEVAQQHRDELGQLLKTEKVWLLLDGVDEMTVSDALHHIASQMNETWLQNVRVVLTCRLNVWDVGKNALDRFDVYRNLDFEYPAEVHQFIDQWFVGKPELQQKLKDALEQPGKERIRDMVKNPLRLTLLCYSWYLRQGELPETKAGLYEWFVDAFYEWNKGKVPTQWNAAKRKELNEALGDLAKAAIDQESSRFRLRKNFISQFLGEADDEDSLFYLALQLGWLNCVGVAEENPFENVYAFFHPTFQEYFAASVIDNCNFFLKPVFDNPLKGNYRVFEAFWKEVILFWFGKKNNQDYREQLIAELIDFDQNCGELYKFRANLLAVEFLAEFSECKSFNQLLSKVISWAISSYLNDKHDAIEGVDLMPEEHLKLGFACASRIKTTSKDYVAISYLSCIRESAIESIQRTNIKKLTEVLTKTSRSYNFTHDYTLLYLLGKIARDNEPAIACIANLLKSDYEGEFLGMFFNEMQKTFGRGCPVIVELLIDTINEPTEKDISLQICGLGDIATNNPLVISTLRDVLKKSNNGHETFLALISLIKIDKNKPDLIPLLLSKIDRYINSWDDYVDASDAFAEINDSEDALVELFHNNYSYAVDELTEFIQSTNQEIKVCFVARFLGKIDEVNSLLKERLTDIMNHPAEEYLLRLAVGIFEELEPGNSLTVEALVKGINDSEGLVGFRDVDLLGDLSRTNKYAVEALIEIAGFSTDNLILLRITEALLDSDDFRTVAIRMLLKLIHDSNFQRIYIVYLCEKLLKIGVYDQQVIFYLKKRLWESESAQERFRILEVLNELKENIDISFDDFLTLVKVGKSDLINKKVLSTNWVSNYVSVNLEKTIKNLKPYLSQENQRSNFELYNICFELMWYCAHNMSYPNFYQTWYSSFSVDSELVADGGEVEL